MPPKELKKILVAEDEEDVRSILELSLNDVGEFTIKICCSGQEALQQVEAFAPDLILLDMMMPGMDGMKTLMELRKIEKVKEIPVVFLTAKTQSDEVAHFREAGALDVIKKPFDPMTLAENLQLIWKQHHG